MTDVHQSAAPEASRPARTDLRTRAMATSGVLAVVLGAAAVLLPAPYVVEAPGPAINTIGESEDGPLIQIEGHKSYPAEGTLALTTVYVYGGPGDTVGFFDVLRGWLDPARAVMPAELVYPPGTTGQEIQDQNAAAMTSSQDAAVAAALEHEGIDFGEQLKAAGFTPDSASKGIVQEGDTLLQINGHKLSGIDFLRRELSSSGGDAVKLTVLRDGKKVMETITPTKSDDGDYQLGVFLQTEFDFPFTVDIALNNVGGPSAGMMFALGIIDKLNPGNLTGDKNFAGTGTIDAEGDVGPIGGIRQKLVGARDAGAEYFLAPAENCGEVAGHVPDGLTVIKVSTLEEATKAVDAVAENDDAPLPGCSS